MIWRDQALAFWIGAAARLVAVIGDPAAIGAPFAAMAAAAVALSGIGRIILVAGDIHQGENHSRLSGVGQSLDA